MSLGLVTKHLFDLISKQVGDYKIVVWYDSEHIYAVLPRTLSPGSLMAKRLGLWSWRRNHTRRSLERGLILVLSLMISCGSPASACGLLLQKPETEGTEANRAVKGVQDVRSLELGKAIERELRRGEAHSYTIALTSGQYLNVAIDQWGIDVRSTLFDPDGKQVMEVDHQKGTQGTQTIAWLTQTAGVYRLEVGSSENHAGHGRYRVRIEQLRQVSLEDLTQAVPGISEFLKTLEEAAQLRDLGTAESLRKAINKYQETLPFLRAENLWQFYSATLIQVGRALYVLGEYQQALRYYEEAVNLFHKLGNRPEEFRALVALCFIDVAMGNKNTAQLHLELALRLFGDVDDKQNLETKWFVLRILIGLSRSGDDKQRALDVIQRIRVQPIRRRPNARSGDRAYDRRSAQ